MLGHCDLKLTAGPRAALKDTLSAGVKIARKLKRPESETGNRLNFDSEVLYGKHIIQC